MILVFGGTTEGRRAVEVLEEAGSPYYYSTRADNQKVELVNGTHLTGGMDVDDMMRCCSEYDIRLIVDAAHPFAEELHRNLLLLAGRIGVPVVRYDRIYPPRTADIVWCRDYADAVARLEAEGIGRLLALTGVNTIGRLRPYWERHEACWFRILNRTASQRVAWASRFPEDRLVYYNDDDDDTAHLISQLRPEAIITKESGLSGGFSEKVEAARQQGVKVFAVERPAYPPPVPDVHRVTLLTVNGPHGLRRAVELLLPEFFPLHSGLTTGTCATAAAVAATLRLLHGETPGMVPVVLPDGETIHVSVTYGDGYASVFKDAGDDPDVTNGLEIRATVEYAATGSHWLSPSEAREDCGHPCEPVTIIGGEGVGTFTLPGFDFPPGEAAINKAPRQMIRSNLAAILPPSTSHLPPLSVIISVPQGAEVARRTFNPRLGIEGGISIIGVSGIVKPFSEEAFIESIRKCMTVAKASGIDRVVINSGAKSERFLRARYPDLPRLAFVEYGNYIGQTLRMAHELQIPNVTLGIMLGKAVKLAAGHLDTHSRRAVMDKDFVAQMLREAHVEADVSTITLARELWEKLTPTQASAFADTVVCRCAAHCRPLLPDGRLTVLLIDDEGSVRARV